MPQLVAANSLEISKSYILHSVSYFGLYQVHDLMLTHEYVSMEINHNDIKYDRSLLEVCFMQDTVSPAVNHLYTLKKILC